MTTAKLVMMIVTAQVALDSIAKEVAQAIGPQAKDEVQRLANKYLVIDETEEAGPVLCAHLAHLYQLLEHYRVRLIDYGGEDGSSAEVPGTETVQ